MSVWHLGYLPQSSQRIGHRCCVFVQLADKEVDYDIRMLTEEKSLRPDHLSVTLKRMRLGGSACGTLRHIAYRESGEVGTWTSEGRAIRCRSMSWKLSRVLTFQTKDSHAGKPTHFDGGH